MVFQFSLLGLVEAICLDYLLSKVSTPQVHSHLHPQDLLLHGQEQIQGDQVLGHCQDFLGLLLLYHPHNVPVILE